MGRVVDLGERLEVEVRIDLRRGDAGMAEHFLDRAQVLRRLEQMRRERVAQHVRMYVLGDAAALRPRLEPRADHGRGYALATLTDEERFFARRRNAVPC